MCINVHYACRQASEDKFWESILFSYVGPKDWPQVDSLSSKFPYPLNCIANSLQSPFW